MSTPSVNGPRVAVIGAGLTGLLAAQGLQKRGFRVTVFEREPHINARPRDWTILVHWGFPLLEKLLPEGILDNIPKAICNPHLKFDEYVESLPCYNGVTGDVLFRNPTPGARRITRQRLRAVLTEGLEIKWGKKLANLSSTTESVHLTFECGETCDVDYVLGADGVSSTVRELLLGAEAARPQLSGFMFATGVVKYGEAEKTNLIVNAHPVAAIMMGTSSVAACGVMYVEDVNDTATWTTWWVKIWKGQSVNLQGQAALDYIKANTKGLCEPFQSAMELSPDGSSCNIDEMKYWVATPWDNHSGRVTLAGDAAHPMLPYRGQGFQHAITSANNYVDSLSKLFDTQDAKTRKEVMTAYDTEMIERGTTAVKQSLKEAEYSLDINTVSKMLMVTHGHGKST